MWEAVLQVRNTSGLVVIQPQPILAEANHRIGLEEVSYAREKTRERREQEREPDVRAHQGERAEVREVHEAGEGDRRPDGE